MSGVDAPSAIAVTERRKSFGEVEAVRGVSFEVGGGEVFGFLGPNGAGKTTTINILCTLARATGGSARVAGFDVATQRDEDQGEIVALDTPAALKAGVGADRVRIETDDDAAAIDALGRQFGIEAVVSEGAVSFAVPAGEAFVPRLFAELGVPIRSVSVSRPTLDDVFMSFTGTTIRDAEEAGPSQANRMFLQVMGGRR